MENAEGKISVSVARCNSLHQYLYLLIRSFKKQSNLMYRVNVEDCGYGDAVGSRQNAD